MQTNGRDKIYTSKQAPNKMPLLLLDVKFLEERFDRRFWIL